ncbi:sulfate adenylyltransferase, partial [bacterium]|nr:sulfate adenylyltransferase [bacterium]
MIAPHGGLKEPINRLVPEEQRAEFLRAASELPKLPVSDADLSSLYRFGDGGLSPLEGPMTKEVFDRVLDDEVILRDGKKYAWTIPIAFPASYEVADSLKVGQKAALVNTAGEIVGTIDVEDVYPFEKARYLRSVYLTERLDHPGAKLVLDDPRHRLV